MSTPPLPAERLHGLTTLACIYLDERDGLQLSPCDGLAPVGLCCAGLHLIHALASGQGRKPLRLARQIAARYGEPGLNETLENLVSALGQRGFLIPGRGKPREPGVLREVSEPKSRQQLATGRPWVISGVPMLVDVTRGGFEIRNHDGEVLACLSPVELMAVAVFRQPKTWVEALAQHERECPGEARSELALYALLSRLAHSGLLVPASGESGLARSRTARIQARADAARMALRRSLRETVKAYLESSTPDNPRVRVIPVMSQKLIPPLALGMIMGAAREFEGGRLQARYDFVPDWQVTSPRMRQYAGHDGVYLFSNYVWSHGGNLALSAEIKALNPRSITVHGGPDVPKYAADVDAWFRDYPHVDVAVHSEGEETVCHMLAALEHTFDGESIDLSCLEGVAGLSYRDGDQIRRTPPRSQIADIDAVPSPYLNGLFDAYAKVAPEFVIIETNRGCPYGCTFCDWGSATGSKVRKFSLERVYAELEWCARNQVSHIYVADANFGMLERDVKIVEKVVELKRKYGFPRVFTTSYAKNKVKYLRPIVQLLAEADIIGEGLLALQTMDTHTLSVIDRSNISTDKYHELGLEFRRAGLPLYVDLMLGLPGSTTESFRNDLQECVDRELTPRIFQTEVLVNSPMNAPAYRERFGIVTATAEAHFGATRTREAAGPGRQLVVACTSFTRDEYAEMLDMRRAFMLFESFGVLRQVSRFVRQETGVREVDFINALRRNARDNPLRWPLLARALTVVPEIMVPPVSWRLFTDEVGRYLVAASGLADDSALQAILQAQLAILPSAGRAFPERYLLAHDVGAWHRDMIAAKDAGALRDWTGQVPRLCEYPPGEFEVSDPHGICQTAIGYNSESDLYGDWELASPASRAMPAHARQYA